MRYKFYKFCESRASDTPLWGVRLYSTFWSNLSKKKFSFGVLHPCHCTDWGEIWHLGATFHPHRCNDKGLGPPKLNFFYSDLTKMWNLNAPQGRIPCAIFTNFAEFVPHFRMRSVLKFGWISSRGYGVMGVLSWGGRVSPKFSAPPSGDTVRQTPNVLEVQERARGPLSPCQVSTPSMQRLQRQGCRTPKIEIFTQIWPKCGI